MDIAGTDPPISTVEFEADVNVEFNEASSRQQINSGESVKTLFGKLKKFLTDLKAVAFSGAYSDLSGVPDLTRYATKAELDTKAEKALYGDTTISVGRLSGSTVGEYSIAEGMKTTASGQVSKASGYYTEALGDYSYSGGFFAKSIGHSSFAYGNRARTSKNNEVAFGIFNISNDDTLFSIGDGKADNGKHNAFEITKTSGKLHDEAIMTQNKISNSNLLINPDFKINQRGVSNHVTPSGTGSFVYTVDRWAIDDGGQVTVNSDGTLTVKGTISQILENAVGDNVTASLGVVSGTATAVYDSAAKKFSITADNAVISWAKLEYGSIATPFIAPDPASELLKCQRYYYCIKNQSTTAAQLLGIGYAQSSAELNVNVNFPSCMRIPPTVTLSNAAGVMFSKGGSTAATSVTAVARNGCMKPFNSITLRCTGTFDAGTAYQIFVATAGFIEFSAEL